MWHGVDTRRPRITLVAPTPPPYAGPEISTAYILASSLAEEFSLHHIRSNLKATNAEKGAFSVGALAKQLAIYYQIIRSRLLGSRGLYVLIAVNVLAFVKDAGSVWLGWLLGMRVVAHMKGATLPAFYLQSSPLLRWLIKMTIGRLEMMIVQSASIRDEIVETLGLEERRIPVVPNMVEANHRCSGRTNGERLLFIGHLSVAKGFIDLLSVLDDVFTDYPDAVLRCAGEPKPLKRDYVSHLVGIDLPLGANGAIQRVVNGGFSQVQYLGGSVHGATKDELFCNSDILILPSYSESFPMAVLEAMSHGCAVIATPVGAVPEMISHGSEGLLVEPGDRASLLEAIRTLLSDPALRHKLATSASAKVEAQYTTEKVVPLYTAVFNQLVESQQDP